MLNIHRSPWTVKRETSFALTKHDFTLFDCLKWFDPVSVELMFTLIFSKLILHILLKVKLFCILCKKYKSISQIEANIQFLF